MSCLSFPQVGYPQSLEMEAIGSDAIKVVSRQYLTPLGWADLIQLG